MYRISLISDAGAINKKIKYSEAVIVLVIARRGHRQKQIEGSNLVHIKKTQTLQHNLKCAD